MRELTMSEVEFVSGGCTPGSSNTFGGIRDTYGLGQDIINIYEGLIEATSYVIERVANAL
ncbi:MAG: hypothetical protein KJO01_12910 [Gammaproteobacteria bacterium]|nr:hypothetical protein [Gammaproteobacteria bacterium]MBT8111079.1 hypothetical protein [Gammaproteobacteria bacterium]NND47996.1 hypothetical protein [Woeseiaceae bacterium]NNL45777.1 hypothetical protein [Woeseiaceae bacterium]